jgi:SAM-dependent methyltransferase
VVSSLPCSEAAERNKAPILDILRRILPGEGVVVEIASGSGQHVAHFAAELPALIWQPSDANSALLNVITARALATGLKNIRPAVELDVTNSPWPVTDVDALVCINMLHISPWTSTLALFSGANNVLAPAGVLFLYGPYRRDGRHTAPSNAAFDESLRTRNTKWGIRDLEEVSRIAEANGFLLEEIVLMPANNLSVVFRRQP